MQQKNKSIWLKIFHIALSPANLNFWQYSIVHHGHNIERNLIKNFSAGINNSLLIEINAIHGDPIRGKRLI